MYDLENGKRLAEAARKALARTTEGPWVNNDQHSGLGWRVETDADGYPNDGWVVASELLGPDAEANARFIAYARSGVPALAADLELAHAEIERKDERIEALTDALNDCVAVLTDPVVGTIYHDEPAWYAALNKAVAKARALLETPNE